MNISIGDIVKFHRWCEDSHSMKLITGTVTSTSTNNAGERAYGVLQDKSVTTYTVWERGIVIDLTEMGYMVSELCTT